MKNHKQNNYKGHCKESSPCSGHLAKNIEKPGPDIIGKQKGTLNQAHSYLWYIMNCVIIYINYQGIDETTRLTRKRKSKR